MHRIVLRTSLSGTRPSLRCSLLRSYHSSRVTGDYPREGVFQPNSPPRTSGPRGGTGPSPSSPTTIIPPNAYTTTNASSRKWPTRSLWVLGALVATGSGVFVAIDRIARVFPIPVDMSQDQVDDTAAMFEEELSEYEFVEALRNAEGRDASAAVRIEHRAYESVSVDPLRRRNMFTAGPLSMDKRGFLSQIVLRAGPDATNTSPVCLFVNFGSGSTSLPGVVHSGLVTTVFDEFLGRWASSLLGQKSVVTANLRYEHNAHCEPGQWYCVIPGNTPSVDGENSRKIKVDAILCCIPDEFIDDENVTAHVHAKAEGLFVVPRGYEVAELPSNF